MELLQNQTNKTGITNRLAMTLNSFISSNGKQCNMNRPQNLISIPSYFRRINLHIFKRMFVNVFLYGNYKTYDFLNYSIIYCIQLFIVIDIFSIFEYLFTLTINTLFDVIYHFLIKYSYKISRVDDLHNVIKYSRARLQYRIEVRACGKKIYKYCKYG